MSNPQIREYVDILRPAVERCISDARDRQTILNLVESVGGLCFQAGEVAGRQAAIAIIDREAAKSVQT